MAETAQKSENVKTKQDNERQICSRCIYDDQIPNISFDEKGVCNYCHQHDAMEQQYPTGEKGKKMLDAIVEDIRKAGKGKKYDCVVGVSGGCDSSYLVHLLKKEYGLRPLAAHFDNTWNSEIATQNIYKVLEALDVDLFTIVVNNKEYDDMYRAFMLSGIKDIEAQTDIGLATTMYMAAAKHGIKYTINGHSFRTEGISPLGLLYFDGKLIEDVHNKHGTMKRKTFPNLTLYRFIKWSLMGFKQIRPLYYLDYNKAATKEMLQKEYGWQWYGGHHLENRFTNFYHSYFMYQRWGFDTRFLEHAALVRSGQMTREKALDTLQNVPRVCDKEIIDLVKKRLGFSDEEFERVMTMEKHSHKEYKTYKKTFERMRWFFWVMYKLNRVPRSFYDKYCANKKYSATNAK